jgi:hypothetical protein
LGLVLRRADLINFGTADLLLYFGINVIISLEINLEGILRFKVPQNIDMQDRILGPLTMVQFIYAVVGFGICYAIFSAIPAPLSYLLVIPIGLFVVCLDFVKVNERPFLNFFMSAIQFAGSPKQRFWSQGSDSDMEVEIYQAQVQQTTHPHKDISHAEIEALAGKIDTISGKQMIER